MTPPRNDDEGDFLDEEEGSEQADDMNHPTIIGSTFADKLKQTIPHPYLPGTPTPEEKFEHLMDHWRRPMEEDSRHYVQAFRLSPHTDRYNVPVKGSMGSIRRHYTLEEFHKTFGGGVYRFFFRGVKYDENGEPTSDRDVTLYAIPSLVLPGSPKPNEFEQAYQNPEGREAIRKWKQECQAAQLEDEDDQEDPSTPPKRPKPPPRDGEDKPERDRELFIHRGLGGGRPNSDLERMKLEAELDAQRALRERAWKVEDEARQGALEALRKGGGGGMSPDTLREIISSVQAGNERAIETFAQTISAGNDKTAEAVSRMLQLLSEPKDDKEVDRLTQLLDQKTSEINAIRAEHQAELARVSSDFREEVRDLRKARDDAEERVKRDLRELFDQERQSWRDTREAWAAEKQAVRQEMKDVEARAEQRLQSLKDSHEALLRTIEENHKTRLRIVESERDSLRNRLEEYREKEISLRDEKQSISQERLKAELQRDTAVADAARLDVGKIAEATKAGAGIAEALGYKKDDPAASKPSVWETLAERGADAAVRIVTHERFGNLMGGLAAAAERIGGARASGSAPPPPPPLPSGKSSPGTSYEEFVTQIQKARAEENKALRSQPAPDLTSSGKEPPKEPSTENPSKPKEAGLKPLPETQSEGLEEPSADAETEQQEQINSMIENLERLAKSGATHEEALDTILQNFGVTRDEASLFISGMSPEDLLAKIGIMPIDLEHSTYAFLKRAFELL